MDPNTVAQRFERAALHYDRAASVQMRVARHLVENANLSMPPRTILDLGAGTGFAAQAARQRWPRAAITAIDASPAMLREAQRKVPDLRIATGDAGRIEFQEKYDVIFSSMMLHWLPQPAAILERWRRGLNPGGLLCVALLVSGSFLEWRDLCRGQNVGDGIWPFPPADFADGIAQSAARQTITINYASALEFLRRLKATGTTMPRPGHKPISPRAMRHLLDTAPRPFPVSYQVLYVGLSTQDKV